MDNDNADIPGGAVIETEYELGQDNVDGQFGPFGFDVHNPVFLISGMTVVAFVFYALALPEQSGALLHLAFRHGDERV